MRASDHASALAGRGLGACGLLFLLGACAAAAAPAAGGHPTAPITSTATPTTAPSTATPKRNPPPAATRPASNATMPNGTWTLTATPPANAVQLCPEYLPTGTRVALQLQGPTRQATEEQRRDELGGRFTLLAPWSEQLCSTGLGQASGFGQNLCEAGRPRLPQTADAVFEDAVFQLSRLSAAQVKDPDYSFFTDQGAKVGARFMLMTLKDKALQWRLWLKSSDEMVAECTATLPGKNNVDSFPLVWRLK